MSDPNYFLNTDGSIIITLLPTVSTTASNVITIPVNTGTYIIPSITNCITGIGIDFAFPVAEAVPAKKKEAGCSCAKCRDFNEYAEANQSDGSFICYACRKGC